MEKSKKYSKADVLNVFDSEVTHFSFILESKLFKNKYLLVKKNLIKKKLR